MNAQRFKRKPILLFSIFISFCLVGCLNYYERNIVNGTTFQTEEFVGEESWFQLIESTSEIKPILNLFSDGLFYEAQDYQFIGNQLIATLQLAKAPNFSVPDKKNFLRKNVPEAYRASFLSTLTLSTAEKVSTGPLSLNLSDIENMTYYDVNTGLTVVASTGVTLLATAGGLGILLAIACNCPRVYTLDHQGNPLAQGSLFSGAIFKSLEREDQLWLKDVQTKDGQFELKVANELPEDEFIDFLNIYQVKVPKGFELAYNVETDGELMAYQGEINPIRAVDGRGNDILSQLSAKDEAVFQFDDRTYKESLNEAIFQFDKSSLSSTQGTLIVKGRQTEWLEEVAEYFFHQFGTDFDEWTAKMDKLPREKYDQNASLRGMSMNAYLETKDGWKNIGTFHNAGITKEKVMSLNLDLSEVEGDKVHIKLESAFKFWELNQVSLAQTTTPLPQMKEVPLLKAVNQDGEDVSSLLASSDGQYVQQPKEGDFINLTFAATASEGESYVLKGKGYYHHVRDYTHAPNKKLLRKMQFYGPLITQDLSLQLDQVRQMSLAMEKVNQ